MRLTIGQKLGAGFGGVLLLMTISSVVVYLSLDKMNGSAEEMTEQAVPSLRAADDMLIALSRTAAVTRGYLLLGSNSAVSDFYATEFERTLSDLNAADLALKESYAGSTDPFDLEQLRAVTEKVEQFKEAHQKVRDAANAEFANEAPTIGPVVELMETTSLPISRQILEAAENLQESASKRFDSERQKLDQNRRTASATLLISTVLGIVLGFLVSVLLTQRIISAVRELVTGVELVAQGDLAQPPVSTRETDEVGILAGGFNTMVASLRKILTEAGAASREVSTSISQISAGAHQQLASLSETASSLNEITSTAEEFKATMQEFADRAKAVHEATDETGRRAEEGIALTRQSGSQIAEVRDNALSAGESVLQLADQMQRIGEITASVNEIAEQTKLLALNASIEAARAGEEGRGFAVVAMQVRELANQSKEASGRIESLIAQTQKSMRVVVNRIEEGGRLSEESTGIVAQVSDAFDEIGRAISQTRQAMSQINTGARQQELGISELVSSIMEIDSASKESVAAAEQTQKSIVSIEERLKTLDTSISTFRV